MLKKSHRLTTKEFDQYFATGKRHHFPHATIVHAPHAHFHGSVVVGKKVVKQAVKRNRLRRRIYAQLQRQLREKGLTGVYIFLVKPSFITLPRKYAAEEAASYIATVVKRT